jgi:hypothetical protein
MQELYSDPSDLDGFDDLKPEDKERIRKALQDGHVAEDDIPPSAKKEGAAAEGTEGEGEDEGEEKPKKKAASRKRKDTEAEGEAAAEKPKRSRTTKAKASPNFAHYVV